MLLQNAGHGPQGSSWPHVCRSDKQSTLQPAPSLQSPGSCSSDTRLAFQSSAPDLVSQLQTILLPLPCGEEAPGLRVTCHLHTRSAALLALDHDSSRQLNSLRQRRLRRTERLLSCTWLQQHPYSCQAEVVLLFYLSLHNSKMKIH